MKSRVFPKGHPCKVCLIVSKCNGLPYNHSNEGCPHLRKYIKKIVRKSKSEIALNNNPHYNAYVNHLRTVMKITV